MSENTQMTFWDHLDELRKELLRIAVAVVGMMCLAFALKDTLFAVVLDPKPEEVRLVSTELAGQFVMHMSVAFYAGLLVAMPYIIYRLLVYVAPALYAHERRHTVHALAGGYVLFMVGVVFNYFVIFPITVRFLADYQVSPEVENYITLQNYVDTLTMMTLMMGIVFEIPIVCRLLAKLGWLTAPFMRQYRRHAVVLILVIAAVITPTTDVFTLMVVALPIYLLFEISISIVGFTQKPNS